MFGSWEKCKNEESSEVIERIISQWMDMCICEVEIWSAKEITEVLRYAQNFKTFLAFFTGTIGWLGQESGISYEEIIGIFLRCVQRNLKYTTHDEQKYLIQTIVEISEGNDYIETQKTGIKNFKSCVINREKNAIPMLNTLLSTNDKSIDNEYETDEQIEYEDEQVEYEVYKQKELMKETLDLELAYEYIAGIQSELEFEEMNEKIIRDAERLIINFVKNIRVGEDDKAIEATIRLLQKIIFTEDKVISELENFVVHIRTGSDYQAIGATIQLLNEKHKQINFDDISISELENFVVCIREGEDDEAIKATKNFLTVVLNYLNRQKQTDEITNKKITNGAQIESSFLAFLNLQ